jgi:hypothetical protein
MTIWSRMQALSCELPTRASVAGDVAMMICQELGLNETSDPARDG